jgi:hypothetical protein
MVSECLFESRKCAVFAPFGPILGRIFSNRLSGAFRAPFLMYALKKVRKGYLSNVCVCIEEVK